MFVTFLRLWELDRFIFILFPHLSSLIRILSESTMDYD